MGRRAKEDAFEAELAAQEAHAKVEKTPPERQVAPAPGDEEANNEAAPAEHWDVDPETDEAHQVEQ